MANILVLHGPNLNMLGLREKQHYGNTTLAQINQQLQSTATTLGHTLTHQQSNAEHELIEWIQQARLQQTADIILINAGAYTHSSIAIRDALIASQLPVIEIHMSNIHAREPFRHTSLISDIAIGCIQGFGDTSYLLGLQAAHRYLTTHCTKEETVDGHA